MNKRRFPLFSVAAILAIMVLVLAACGGGSETTSGEAAQQDVSQDEEAGLNELEESGALAAEEPAEPLPDDTPATITYWHTMSDPETEQFDQVVAAFEAANPEITVETTRFAYDDFKEALLTGLAGGEGPDTARMDIVWVPEFANEGALMQLDGAMPGFTELAADLFPGPLATNFWQGHFYGLPQNTNTQILLVNNAVFEAAGIDPVFSDLGEFARVACELSDPDNEQYGFALGGTYFWAPAPVFYSMGGAITDLSASVQGDAFERNITTSTGYVNNDDSVAGYALLTEMYNDGCLSPNVLGGGIGTADGFATGKYAMITDGPWMVDIYQGSYPDLDYQFQLMPTGPGGTNSSVVGGEDVVIFADTESADAAMKWAEYLVSPEAQLTMAEVGVIPTRASLLEQPDMPPYFYLFLEQLKTAQARTPHPAWGDIDGALNNAFQRMLRGEQTPQEALDEAAGEIDALLAQ